MKRCLIIAGGDYAPIEPEEGDYILACDKGYAWCRREGIVPDLILGDFDSYGGKLPEGVPVLRFPAEKDDTDTMLAVRWASEQGFKALRLCCCFGGRLDHLLSNVETLHYAAALGMEAEARDERLAWMIGYYAALAMHAPRRYPRRSGECIRAGHETLREQGVTCTLEWNQGNHFKNPDLRTAKAFAWLLNTKRPV